MTLRLTLISSGRSQTRETLGKTIYDPIVHKDSIGLESLPCSPPGRERPHSTRHGPLPCANWMSGFQGRDHD